MKQNVSFRSILFLMLVISAVLLNGCVDNNSDGINQIEDIDKLDEIISVNRVEEYHIQEYERYEEFAEQLGFDGKLDDKLNFKITYKSDDYEVVGYICVPTDYLERDYPVLIYNRGGNRDFGMLYPIVPVQYSDFGFITLVAQYRGNDGGTGKEAFGGDDVQDVISLIDIAEQLSFSNGKIYMMGDSRGGLQTYCTLRKESLAGRKRISAAVVMSGISDLTEFYNFGDWEMKGTLISLIGGDPETLPKEYERRSAVHWPELIDVPLLIVHGQTDERVPVNQAETIYNMLKALDKNVGLRLYDAGHNLSFEEYLVSLEWLRSY